MTTPSQPTPDRDLSKILDKLYGRINYERQVRVSPTGFRLDKMRELLDRLGNPQSAWPAIHVAGTKGKGSVTTMVGSILTTSGFRTGVYTSPHLEKINQRMAVDGQVISDTQLLAVLAEMGPAIEAMDQEAARKNGNELTFFEITTAAAMLFFAQQSVDYAVLEVGLGGRLDSTNVCEPAVCVITNISLDHTRQLGNTIGKIAREKAGIIKPEVPVISGAIQPDAAAAIAEVA
jgi:dihydrofolate synthase/folylpolyglutamate synthase